MANSHEDIIRQTMTEVAERTEFFLEKHVGMMSLSDIAARVRSVKSPNLTRYFCDDKLLFEVIHYPDQLKWEFREAV